MCISAKGCVKGKKKKLMNCLVMYIQNLSDEGISKISSVLMKRKRAHITFRKG